MPKVNLAFASTNKHLSTYMHWYTHEHAHICTNIPQKYRKKGKVSKTKMVRIRENHLFMQTLYESLHGNYLS